MVSHCCALVLEGPLEQRPGVAAVPLGIGAVARPHVGAGVVQAEHHLELRLSAQRTLLSRKDYSRLSDEVPRLQLHGHCLLLAMGGADKTDKNMDLNMVRYRWRCPDLRSARR